MLNHKVQSPTILEAKPIMSASRRMLVDSLLLTHKSIHSRFHGTLAYLIDFCEKARIGYTLEALAYPVEGYILKTKPHKVTRVVITSASIHNSRFTGKPVYIQLRLKTIEGKKLLKVLTLDGPGAILTASLLSSLDVAIEAELEPLSLRRKTFYCRLEDEKYGGKKYKKVIPIKVWQGV